MRAALTDSNIIGSGMTQANQTNWAEANPTDISQQAGKKKQVGIGWILDAQMHRGITMVLRKGARKDRFLDEERIVRPRSGRSELNKVCQRASSLLAGERKSKSLARNDGAVNLEGFWKKQASCAFPARGCQASRVP